jgi:hypothetical protein
MQAEVTIFENIYADNPHYIGLDKALARIKTGKSKTRIEEIRNILDKGRADSLKRQLPSICFSGKFTRREDAALLDHSGFIVLDFDEVEHLDEKAAEIIEHEFIYACWLSPRGNGLKALARVADGTKHREHFAALQEVFPDVDRSGVNPSRVCFESYDPNIYTNPKAVPFKKVKTVEKVEQKETVKEEKEVFKRLLTWLSNRNDAFVTGERNFFIFKLAAACCRFGLDERTATALIVTEYPPSTDFTMKECSKAIRSAYRSNKLGTASFEKDILVDKVTRKEVDIQIDPTIYDLDVKPKDVIYGEDVKEDALNIRKHGYPSVLKLDIPLDDYFKSKRGEITLLSGIGNYGKSAFNKWYMLMRILKFGEKFASFAPEDNPPQEYYHDFVEMLMGCDCTPTNPNAPNLEMYGNAYDFISKHIFYVYPKELSPTPEYIKERFLELLIKEKIDGVCIDPFNQMTNDYSRSGGRSDKYLETLLGDFARFAQDNNIYFTIIAHPRRLEKKADGNYPCPDLFDIADGAMWNNKMDNFLVYHRPFMQVNPDDPACEFHSKKIRRQKVVGKKGLLSFEYHRAKRRFEFVGVDPMEKLIKERGLSFKKEQQQIFKAPEAKTYRNVYLDSLGDKNPF